MTVCYDVGSENRRVTGGKVGWPAGIRHFNLMTDAPQSASCLTAVGPARARVRSSTLYFEHRRGWFECHRTIPFPFFCSAGEVPGQFFTMG